jgi:TPR repeat protein
MMMFDSDSSSSNKILHQNTNQSAKKIKQTPPATASPSNVADEFFQNKIATAASSSAPSLIPIEIKESKLLPDRSLIYDSLPRVKSLHSGATQGHADDQFKLGYSYENGDGVEDNCVEAAHWYRKAADQGHTEAKYRLGLLYRSGLGVNRNWITAADWIKSAAKDGYAPAIEEQVGIANLAEDEANIQTIGKSDKPIKITPITESKLDSSIHFARGLVSEQGIGGAPNYKNAANEYRLAAEQGHKKAQYSLSLLYRKGLGVNQDLDEADRWLKLSNQPN